MSDGQLGAERPTVFPALRYKDGRAAIAWLGRAFGFEEKLVVPGANGRIAHAELSLGSGAIMIGSTDPSRSDGNPWGKVHQGVYAYVEDVDGHYKQAKAAGAQIVMDLHETGYGSREYSALDPEGHLWSFGSYPGAQSSDSEGTVVPTSPP